MADVRWTNEQLQAITARGTDILVSAAAGSGKTAVLTERAMRRMTGDDPSIDADRLLIVTFTKAAAAEMRQRLQQKLSQALAQQPDNPLLKRQFSLLQRASIGTIHSFCMELLRQNFQAAALPAAFRIGDAQELSAMKDAAVSKVLEEAYTEPSPEFLAIVDLFGDRRGDASLQAAILTILEYARANPFYRDWLSERAALYHDFSSPEQSVWADILFSTASELIDYAADCALRGQRYAEQSPDLAPYAQMFMGDLALVRQIEQTCRNRDWDAICRMLNSAAFSRMPTVKSASSEEKSRVKALRESVKDCVHKLSKQLFITDLQGFAEDIADLLPQISCLFSLVEQSDDILQAQKRELGVLDFSDLEQMTLDILVEKKEGKIVKTALAKELSARFDEVMTDEFQDVNAAQDMLLWAISNGKNSFMVGDVKQSIYRFRQAMPALFIDKLESFRLYAEGANTPSKILLNGSFRSRREMTNIINTIFSAVMTKRSAELDYDEGQSLVPLAEFPPAATPALELCLLPKDGDSELTGVMQEARLVARKVQELLSGGLRITDRGEERLVRPSDIAILFRTKKKNSALYAKALAELSLPASVEGEFGFLTCTEIVCVTNLLAALSNPLREVELVGAMMSPLFCFTADELAQLRVDGPGLPLYLALQRQGTERFGDFYETFESLRALSSTLSVDELLLHIFSLTGYDLLCRAMSGGEQRFENLNRLVQYARSYHDNGYRGLTAFVRLLDKIMERGEDLKSAVVAESKDAVTITSIHGSKGLEWPVVFLADTATKHSFLGNDLISPYILHNDLGFACVRRDVTLKKQFVTVPLTAVRRQSEQSLLAEELRVLYVAMTRAKEKLIVTAVVSDPEKKLAELAAYSEQERLADYEIANTKSFLDILLMGLSRYPKIDQLLTLHRTPDLLLSVEEQPEQQNLPQQSQQPEALPDLAAVEVLSRRIQFTYPQGDASKIPAKMAVSALSHRLEERFAFSQKPSFIEQSLDSAQSGTAMHLFLQLCRLSPNLQIEAEIERLRSHNLMTEAQLQALNLPALEHFFQSATGRRLLTAKQVLREYRFMAPASCSNLATELVVQNGESTMLEGIADCLLTDEMGTLLLDYKTDRVTDGEILRQRYASQLLLYRDMLEFHKSHKIDHAVIYSFALNQEFFIF